MEKVNYKGWPNCYRLSNSQIDLVVTTDVGPRVIRLGFIGAENEFKEFSDQVGQTGGDTWRSFGGHRLWHAPEQLQRTYYPDNFPIAIQQQAGFIRLIQPVEATTGIQKELDIELSLDSAHVKVIHRLRNANLWTVELAVWALTVMEMGGAAILPLPPRGSHSENLVPSNSLSMWAYTNMADPRWTWGRNFIMLRQDLKAETPQKIGAMVPDGWMGYARGGHLFVKKASYLPGAVYPDFGCSMETYTNDQILEVESLSPMAKLEPNATIEHIEDWYLFKDVPSPQNEEDICKDVMPRIMSLK